jgi:hypothetical protein
MNSRSLLRKFLQTRQALDETMKSILDINRKRKAYFSRPDPDEKSELAEELRVLNATADIQARALNQYQHKLKVNQRA